MDWRRQCAKPFLEAILTETYVAWKEYELTSLLKLQMIPKYKFCTELYKSIFEIPTSKYNRDNYLHWIITISSYRPFNVPYPLRAGYYYILVLFWVYFVWITMVCILYSNQTKHGSSITTRLIFNNCIIIRSRRVIIRLYYAFFIFCHIHTLWCKEICQNNPALPSCFDKFLCILETVYATIHSVPLLNPKIKVWFCCCFYGILD